MPFAALTLVGAWPLSAPGRHLGAPATTHTDTHILSLYSSHLACLFPQHGPGKKHERAIELEAWQWHCVQAAPWGFLRGCIRSDGCAFINRTGPYSYLTYYFGNRSADIRGLFTQACDQVGVAYRVSGEHIRINRRASVALMQEHVGLKT